MKGGMISLKMVERLYLLYTYDRLCRAWCVSDVRAGEMSRTIRVLVGFASCDIKLNPPTDGQADAWRRAEWRRD